MCANIEGQISADLIGLVLYFLFAVIAGYLAFLAWFRPQKFKETIYQYLLWSSRYWSSWRYRVNENQKRFMHGHSTLVSGGRIIAPLAAVFFIWMASWLYQHGVALSAIKC
jgi:hypothetical protein